ncbi:MAG TPA: sugar phosphate isomerase/epimerase [Terriglobales bacterium]|jgi:sugar phosphate isomerase/epimerase
MITRRDFLRDTALVTASLALPRAVFAANKQPVGLQLYTVRQLAEKDLPNTLGEIHSIGYEEVELYWNVYSHPAPELKRMISDAGLKAPSGHFDYEGLESKLDYAKELGLQYVVCPMLPEKMWHSGDDFKRAADQFNKWGEQVQKLGMTFGFHNHNYEFQKFGNQTGFDILMKNTDPKLVKLEMDCYWITQSGNDPLKMFDRLGSRIRMLHLKDRKRGFAPSQMLNKQAEHFTEVGTGTVDWKAIIARAKANAVDHYFVEQDETQRPVLESIRISYNNAARLLNA